MRNPHNRMLAELGRRRCERCRLVRIECLCNLIPRVETRTRIVLVLHRFEDRKPSNTGRLAQLCLPNSAVIIRGGLDGRTSQSPDWSAEGDPVLLFPHPGARPLEEWAANPRPITLVVPDGTWRQAQRVHRRTPGLEGVPCAFISRAAPSSYRLRRTPDPRRLATLEAIAEALAILEGSAGPDTRLSLLRIFEIMVERSLRVRSPAPRPRAQNPAPEAVIRSGDVDLGIEDS